MEKRQLENSGSDSDSIVINSGGRLTIETIAEFMQRVIEGLSTANTVTVEFNPEVEADITTLQVICSACKTAADDGKVFSCQGPLPPALTALISAAGAERHGGCVHNGKIPCPWFGGAN